MIDSVLGRIVLLTIFISVTPSMESNMITWRSSYERISRFNCQENWRKFSRFIRTILQHKNSFVSLATVRDYSVEQTDHPSSFFPDLAPSESHLFTNIKNTLLGTNITVTVTSYLLMSTFLFNRIKASIKIHALQHRRKKCTDRKGGLRWKIKHIWPHDSNSLWTVQPTLVKTTVL